jgi:hypothetical protein
MVTIKICEEPLDQVVENLAQTIGGSFPWRIGKIEIFGGVRYE